MPAHLLANGEGNVAVLDHVLDLALHGDKEEHQPVHEQDGPEHRHIKHREEGHHKAQQQRLKRRVPARTPSLSLSSHHGRDSDSIWHDCPGIFVTS